MANYFRSVGYTSENIHTGMIFYLCDLWNDEKREPLRSFFSNFGIELEDKKLLPKRERKGENLGRNRIDLVVSYEDEEQPFVAIEMKVDSHEKLVGDEPQTTAYRKNLDENAPLLYSTRTGGRTVGGTRRRDPWTIETFGKSFWRSPQAARDKVDQG